MTARVAASEADLVAMTRALVAPHAHDAATLFARARALPPHIGPSCAALVEDALRKVWPALWRRDGARPRDGRRGWDRHAPAPLPHTAATLRLVRWLVAMPLGGDDIEPLRGEPLALGDEIVCYLALDASAAQPAIQAAIARQPFVRGAALAHLGFAHLMLGEPPPLGALATGAGAIVVEALGRDLAARWRSVELGKRAIADPERLVALGAAQDGVLRAFMRACERRRDLAAWILDAAAPLLARGLAPIPERLDPAASLARRAAARNAAGALLRAIVRWREWDDEHRGVRFVDDGYADAQRLLAAFERVGRAGADRAAAWLADLAALAPGGNMPRS